MTEKTEPQRNEEDEIDRRLRGDIDDEDPMNAKSSGIVPALIVGVIVAVANIYISRSVDRSDTTAETLAALKEQVSNLSEQVSNLAEQPYVRREEFEASVSGLNQRLGNVEREIYERKR